MYGWTDSHGEICVLEPQRHWCTRRSYTFNTYVIILAIYYTAIRLFISFFLRLSILSFIYCIIVLVFFNLSFFKIVHHITVCRKETLFFFSLHFLLLICRVVWENSGNLGDANILIIWAMDGKARKFPLSTCIIHLWIRKKVTNWECMHCYY